MIAVDTNVLVRYLVEDDADQTERAARLIESALGRGERVFVSQLVACKTVWVLVGGYGFSRTEVASVLRALLAARQVVIEQSDEVRAALEGFEGGPADFADYLILERGRAAGCESLASFDRKLATERDVVTP